MSPIAYIDAVSVLACLTALVYLMRGWKRPNFLTAIPLFLMILLFLMTFYATALFLEWSGITGAIDLLEDFCGLFIPFLWAFVFYAVFKSSVEEDLIASREHFRELVEATSDWIWEVDVTLRYTYVSPRIRDILGYEPEEILGKTPFELMSPEAVNRVKKDFELAYRAGRPVQHLENINLHKDGHEVVLETNAVPVLDKAGNVIGYRGVDRDVTIRKKAEEKIIEERDKAQRYLDIAGVMILALDKEGRVILLNKRGCEILQCTEDEALGKNWFETFLPFSYRQIVRTYFDRIMDSEEISADYFENPILTHRSVERLIAWHIVALRDASGSITGVICSGEDITEARSSEIAARESDERLRVALSAVEMGTWRWSPATNEDTRDANLNALLGLESVESTQNIEEFFQFVHPDDRVAAKADFERAMLKQEPFQSRFRIVRPDGQTRWVLDRGKPFYDFNGKLEYVTGVVVDITERQRAVLALRENEKRFRAAANYTYDWETWINSDDKIEWINPAVERISGYTVQECQQMEDYPLPIVHEEDRDRVAEILKEALGGSTGNDRPFRIQKKDGSILWCAISWQPICDEQGHSLGYRSSVRDISERKQAEEEIRTSRDSLKHEMELFENMFHTIPDAIYIKDLQSRFTHVNEGWLHRGGFGDEQEVLGKTDFDVYTEEHARPAYEDEQKIMQTGIPKAGYTEKETWPDGHVTWCLSTKMPLRDVAGNIIGMIGISHDITDRKEAEETVRKSEERYRKFIQITSEGIARYEYKEPMPIHLPVEEQIKWISEKGILAECNDRFAHMYGYKDADAFIGTSVFDLWKNKEVATEVISQLIRDGYQRVNDETHETTQEGVEKYFLNNMVSIIENDHLTSHWLTQIDVTEEVARRKELQFTQFAVDHASEGAFWMKPDATIFYVNDAACRSLGYTRDELLQMSVYDIDPDVGPEEWAAIWDITRTQGTPQIETRHKRKDGRIFPVEINGNYVVYDGKEYSIAFSRDITERKAAEQMHELLMQQLREHNDELQSIVYTATHDLRSPLVNIAGFTGELEKDLERLSKILKHESLSPEALEGIGRILDDDVTESLSLIKSGSRQMDRLLNGLLRLSRIGSSPVAVKALDINALLSGVVDGLQYQINECGVNVDIQPNLPKCLGDMMLLSQVFTNLLDNAIKYSSPDREPVINVSASAVGEMIEYVVADNGIGMDKGDVNKVFELFHRLGSRENKSGEGMGLTIVRRILNRLNGSVSMTSEPDSGTVVRVQLPKA